MLFRNLGQVRSSTLIRESVSLTVAHWLDRYGELPTEALQTEVRADAVRSEIPGYCYRRAGWKKVRESRGLVYLECPRAQIERVLTS